MNGLALRLIMPRCPRPDEFAEAMLPALERAGLADSTQRLACFLGQIAWESAELRFMREVWENSAQQERYERDPIAPWPHTAEDKRNRLAYQLGNYAHGDGYAFRGAGPLQVTGRANITAASGRIYGDDRLVATPELLNDTVVGFELAGDYWAANNLNAYADADDLRGLTQAINGAATNDAPSHYLRRLAYTQRALEVLKSNAA